MARLFFGAVKLLEEIGQRRPARRDRGRPERHLRDSSGVIRWPIWIHARPRQVRLALCGLNHQPLDIARRTGLIELAQVEPAAGIWPA